MQKLLTELSDLIFPPSANEKILRAVDLIILNNSYQKSYYRNLTYLYRYSDPAVQAAITENKFHHNHLAAKILGLMLDEWIREQEVPTVFVPVPLGKKRFRERGHNQVETILKSTSEKIQINNKLLTRVIETAPQSHLDKKDRRKNIKNAFAINKDKPDFTPGTQIILIDDVVTTGETLLAARAKLAPHLPPGVTLICLALAH